MKSKQPSLIPEEDGMCAGQARGFPLRSDLDCTPIEDVTLDLFRCVCALYVTGSGEPWHASIDLAERRLGPGRGPLALSLVTALVRAMLAERKRGYSYLSPGCSHVSPDEKVVIDLLRAARSGDRRREAQLLQMTLGDFDTAERTLFSMRSLANFQATYTPPAESSAGNVIDIDRQTARGPSLH